jgi:hypothetical protein
MATARFNLIQWADDTELVARTQFNDAFSDIDDLAAGISQSATSAASLTASSYPSFFHFETNGDPALVELSYSTGAAWRQVLVADADSSFGLSVTDLDGTSGVGTSGLPARSDHKHSIGTNAISNSMLATGISASKITGTLSNNTTGAASLVSVASSASTTGSLAFFESATGNLGAKTDASLTYNASTNTLSVPSISGNLTGNVVGGVTGDVTGNADTASSWAGPITITLGTDASGSVAFDGSAGETLNVTIAPDAVTYSKLQNVSGSNVVLGKPGASGQVQEISAGADQVLRRSGSGDLGFGTIVTNNITDGAVTDVKITSTKFADMSDSDNSGRKVSVSTSAPTSPSAGDVWIVI